MSAAILDSNIQHKAKLFAVLGDPTRLKLVSSLIDGEPRSITELSQSFTVSRQAVTKHLGLLENADLVERQKSGKQALYSIKIEPLSEMRESILQLESQWAETLGRLKSFVEN